MKNTRAPGAVKKHLETAEKTGVLVLSDRKLMDVPDLSSLSKVLRTLDLSTNKLSRLPDSICSLSNLKHLTINNNKIEFLPEEMGSLTKLESISATSNQLALLPQSFSKLRHLKSIILSDNKVTSFPLSICGLPQMDVVDFSGNSINEVPDGIENLQAVEVNLNQNQISMISVSVASCPRLKTLRLEENCLSLLAIPTQLLSDSKVSLLCVDGNLFKMKEFEELEGHVEYMERYTAVKKKMF
ncbi:unnamed protein product, partial [Meganyctiphanes norvegica]